ncbi:MAG: GLPGLI family protein, partial [Bacteroidota bacterium]
ANVFSYRQLPRGPIDRTQFGWWMFNDEETDVFFTHYEDSTSTDLRYVTDRSFILQDKWTIPEWNIAAQSAGMKEIPLPTKLATAISIEGDTLMAYYTPSIPYPIGPQGYGGLPGAIVYLKVQNDGGYTEYKMISMQPSATPLALEPPKEGKVITREKFEKLEARAEEMRARRRRSWERN